MEMRDRRIKRLIKEGDLVRIHRPNSFSLKTIVRGGTGPICSLNGCVWMCRLLCIAVGNLCFFLFFFSTRSPWIRKDSKTDRLNWAPATFLKSRAPLQLPTNSVHGLTQLTDFNAMFLLYLPSFPGIGGLQLEFQSNISKKVWILHLSER